MRSRWAVASTVMAASLVCSILIAGATRPPGLFPKYLDAVQASAAEQADRLLDYSPLYLAIARILRPLGTASMLWMQCLLHALTAASAALAVGYLVQGKWALLAGLGTASYRPFLVYCGVEEPEIAIVACLCFATLLAISTRQRLAPTRVRARVGVSVIGACAAISAAGLLRPQYLVLLPVWAIWMASPSAVRSVRIRIWTTTTLVAAVIVLPVLISRSLAAGFPVIMNPGPVFYEGNCPPASGLVRYAPETVRLLEGAHPGQSDYGHVAYRRIAAATGPLAASKANLFWTGLALEGMRAFPGESIERFGRKALMSIMPHEGHDLMNAEDLDRRIRRRIPWGFGILLMAGPLLAFARRETLISLAGPVAVGALSIIVQIVFYASARQRLPLALALLVIGPVVASEWWKGGLRLRARRSMTISLAIAAAAFVAFASGPMAILDQLEWNRVVPAPRLSWGERIANVLEGSGLRTDRLVEARRFAISVDLMRRGQAREAASMIEPLCHRRLDFTISDATVGVPEYWLALAQLSLQHRPAATDSIRTAAARRPGEPRIAALSLRLDHRDQFASLAPQWSLPGCDPMTTRWVLAAAASADGDQATARGLIEPLTGDFPELARTSPDGH